MSNDEIHVPYRMSKLPVDHRGFVVPFFVAWINGKPDHRIVDPVKLHACIVKRICWLCGLPLGSHMAFVVGPMCGINRISSEPGQHLECSRFAVWACPFLSRPHMHRREAGLPADEPLKDAAGVMLKHNPTVSLIWVTKKMNVRAVDNGIIFELGDPTMVEFYKEGRFATRPEIDASIDLGFTKLLEKVPTGEAELLRKELAKFQAMLPNE